MSQLFRDKALEAKRDAWIGRVQITQPLPVKIVAFVGVALLGLTIAFAVVGHYTRRVTAAGVLLPRDGLLNLSSNVVGIVAKCAAEEGQKVQKGELLFVIDREANSVAGPTVRRVIDSLGQQKALLQQQRDLAMTAARSEKDQLQAQILNEQAQHAELAQRIATGTESMRELKEVRAKLEAAKKNNLVTESSFQFHNTVYLDNLARLAADRQNYLQIEGRLTQAKANLAALDHRTQQSVNEIDKTILTVEQQITDNEAKLSLHILAPADGVVTGLRVHVGQAIEPNLTLATLLPNSGTMEANLFIDSSAIGFLRVNAPVLLRYSAFPFQRFGLYEGRVKEITLAPITQDMSAPKNASEKDSLYRVVVTPDLPYVLAHGKQQRLEAGMQVQASIEVDRRRLYEWMFDPLYQIQKSVRIITGGGV